MDIRYIAGIIDGEGTITLSKDSKDAQFRRPVVTVPSTTVELIDAFKQQLGGAKSSKKTYQDNHSPSWVWALHDRQAVLLLKKIWKYLLVPEKSYRAKLIINEYQLLTKRNGKYSLDEKAAKLDFEKRFFEVL